MNDSDNQDLEETLIGRPIAAPSNENNDLAAELQAEEGQDQTNIEGELGSSIQIAPTANNSVLASKLDDDPFLFIELGDRIVIDSNIGRTSGIVYYRSEDLIRVLPDGVSNILRDFPVSQTEQGEVFDEDLGVTVAYVIEKRKFDSFVEQRDIQLGQTIETINSSGDIDKKFTVTLVDEENDAIEVEDESGATERIEFGFYGIPLDESFIILRVRQEPANTEPQDQQISPELREGEDEDEDELEELPKPKIKIIGYLTLTKATVFKEAPATQQRFPDNLQKTDALNDFLNMLDPALQKDPKAIREIRHLVETLFYLKQATVSYNDDGSVKGQQEVSAITIADLIRRTNVPLGRPILDVAKKLYLTSSDEAIDTGDNEQALEGEEYYFINQRNELNQSVDNKGAIVSSDMSGAQNGQITQFWYNLSTTSKQYQSTFVPNNTAEPLWKANYDSEFFRNQLPDLSSPSIDGYIPPEKESGATEPIFDKVSFGIERALTTTYRKGTERKKQLLIPEENATMKGYLIFPQKVVAHMGKSRSGSIAVDSGRSQLPPKTTRQILEEVGDAQEVGTSNDLILLDVNGNTLGNIPLKDYIEGLTIPSLGLGDTFKTLEQYGIDNLELTPDIINVLEDKIEAYQSQLLGTLTKLREELASSEIQEPSENNLIDNLTLFEGSIRDEPTLVEDMETFERINPSLSKSDIARVAYLLKKHSDYFQVAVGKNSVYTAKERIQSTRNMFLESLEIAKLLKIKKTEGGEPPMPNKCEHVAKLNTIRKQYDDNDRFQLLTKFFAYYQGDRQDNWINCNRCERQLLCVHERLLIQAFLNPAEKDGIFKEIVLNFSGGQFQGKYICKNCGQAIRDIDFDTNLEYDDEGKPMSGRAILEDKDAKLQDKINKMISAPVGTKEDEIENFDKDEEVQGKTALQLTEKEREYYSYISEISERIGIVLRDDHMKRAITRTMNLVAKLHTREQYKKFKEKNPALADYDVMLSRETLYACAAFLLLEIQLARPPYPIHRPLHGCRDPGFDGYPIDPDIDKKQGINYISCALATIHRNDAPWNKTGFHSKKGVTLESKVTTIAQSVLRIIKNNVSNDEIQQQISDKKKFLLQLAGKEAMTIQIKDEIPATFLPEQIILSRSKAAENAVIPEVANLMGEKGKSAVAKQWIRQSHELALKTASLIRGSPLIETTCCLSNISKPNTFWDNATDLPQLDKRRLIPKVQGAFLQVHYNPRPMESLLVQPDSDIYYRVFLKYCFQGPRFGYLHEPGLTNKCYWCGFQFPSNPNILDTDTEGKSALITQSVKTDSEEFIALLDKIHQVNSVQSIKPRKISSMEEIMNEFSKITPPPTENWNQVIMDTSTAFSRMPKDVNAGDIAAALIEISNESGQSEDIVKLRIKPDFAEILDEITRLPWLNFYQVLQTYFIIPFKRILTQFSTDSLFIPAELKISELHTQDIKKFIDIDVSLISYKGEAVRKPTALFARSKLSYFVEQMGALLPYKNKIRPTVVPGRYESLMYIQRAILYGPIATLIDPSSIPPGAESLSSLRSVADPSMTLILELINFTLNKYRREKLSFDDKQIKELIAVRNEKERVNVIKKFDRMTDEERAVELMNKKLGLGDWAVGGTKVIYAYDADYYDLERSKREQAGIIDFPGLGPDEMVSLDGRPVDGIGLFEYGGDAEYEREGGYNFEQTGEDDA